MYVGKIVRSKCGRDRKRLYAIVGIVEDGRVLIANGELHRLSSPKKKSLKHLSVLAADNARVTSYDLSSDEKLKNALREYELSYVKNGEGEKS